MALSVIIPYFDETIFIRQAVASCLALDNALHEIILVDDGPLGLGFESVADLPDAHKVSILRNERNLGPPATRNAGLESARGEHVMFLDGDDLVIARSLLAALQFAQDTAADITHLPTLVYRPAFGSWNRFERDHRLLATRRAGLTIDDAPELRYTVASWSWLFRRDFLMENELRFDADQRRYVDHLYAVNVLQKASRISTFDQYPHVWRRRGASVSTERENDEHYRNLIDSVPKTARILLEHYAPDSREFQCDLGFFAARLFGEWGMLWHCLKERDTAPSKAQLLRELAEEMRPFTLDPAIVEDPILKRLYSGGVSSGGRAPIALEELPRLYQLVTHEDWPALGERLGITSAPPRPAAVGSDLQVADHIDTPALALWQAYAALVAQDNGFEHRLFSEFLLDEIDAYCFAMRDAAVGLEPGVSVTANDDQALWPEAMESILETVARRFGAAPDARGMDRSETLSKLRAEAAGLTNAYVIANSAAQKPPDAPPRSDVLDRWREWESAVLGEAMPAIDDALFVRGEQACLGDANWKAQRTVKSRLRARVLEPLLGR